jgi:uncharacterized hydrophobic protein (TIGR00271 family)
MSSLLRRLRPSTRADAAEHAKITAAITEGAELRPRYAFMIVMSCGIAILGLLQNSAAVIIGAMLISPLMAPIVALGFSLCLLDFERMRRSLITLGAGVILALTIAIVVVLISPLRDPTSEILARTQPNLFDLLVAVFSGLAGGYAVIQGRGETIVGVAIATALMPPLAVTGYGLATGQASVAEGAGFLFMTNLLAIALSVSLVARWYGFAPSVESRRDGWQAAIIVATFAMLSVPLGISLLHIAQLGRMEHITRAEVESYLARFDGSLASFGMEFSKDQRVSVDVIALIHEYHPTAAQELQAQLGERLARPVEVSLQQIEVADNDPRDTGRSLAELQTSIDALRSTMTRSDPTEDFRRRLSSAVGQNLGAMGLDPGARRARVFVEGQPGLSLAASQALESKLAGLDPAWTVTLVPAISPLPWIEFEPTSIEIDAEGVQVLELCEWALRRWGVESLEVEGYASSDGTSGRNRQLALARAEAVADWLRARDFEVTTFASFDRRSQLPLEREMGLARFRRVEIRPQTVVEPANADRGSLTPVTGT